MLNSHKLGIVLGGFFAFIHLIWVFLVVAGWAGPILSFVYRIHFVDLSFAISDWSLGNAVMLIVFTGLTGYVSGQIFGTVWNFVHKKEDKEDYVVDKGY